MRHHFLTKTLLIALIGVTATLSLNACETATIEAKYPTSNNRISNDQTIYESEESIFGEDGLFSTKRKSEDASGATLGVNSYLWRASLDTVSFMPLSSADPFGGTILTDWHTPAGKSNERFKVNVFILSRKLTADGVTVTVFRQKRKNGSWVDSPTDKETATKLEDSILTRARQLRVAKLGE